MLSHQFFGTVKKTNKAIVFLIPLLYLGIASFWVYRMFQDIPSFMTLENIGRSIFVAFPFYMAFLSIGSIKNVLLTKFPSDFNIKYQLFDSYLEVNYSDVLTRLKYSDIVGVTNPDRSGNVIKLQMQSGQELAMAAPENKQELYFQLKQKLEHTDL
jgi:hypothetical protein